MPDPPDPRMERVADEAMFRYEASGGKNDGG